jgi:hypothetical protein
VKEALACEKDEIVSEGTHEEGKERTASLIVDSFAAVL